MLLVIAMLVPDQRLHFAPDEPQPRVAVHRSLLVVELAGPNALNKIGGSMPHE